jgi:hypothetical protein
VRLPSTRHRVLAIVLLAAVILSACSDDGDSASDGSDPTTTTAAGTNPDTTDAAPSDTLRIANLNMLHGLPLGNCPPETEGCKAAVRLDMVWQLLEEAGCPEVVTLQEVGPAQKEGIEARIGELCDGAYSIASETGVLPTEQWILTSLPVIESTSARLAGISRSAQLVRVDSPIGPADIVTTHFVAGSIDGGPCTAELCPSGVCDIGTDARLCNAMEVLELIESSADRAGITIVTGDLNDPVDGPSVGLILDAGFVDVWSEAGNDECDPATAENCTSGQTGEGPYDGLDLAENVRDERIDFILARTPDDCELDVVSAAMFAGEPFDPPMEGIYWASDHAGVQAEVACA